MNQLFRLSSDVFNVINLQDIDYTFRQMKEMNLGNPPYRKFAIEVSKKFLTNLLKKIDTDGSIVKEVKEKFSKDLEDTSETFYDHNMLFRYSFTEDYGSYECEADRIYDDGLVINMNNFITQQRSLKGFSKETLDTLDYSMTSISKIAARILVVLLATKNADKNQIIDKDLARGRYNKSKAYRKDYPITTTITIGKITETHTSGHGGGTVRPHLRRGHIRTQKYGPKYELSKKIFIEPVFVNADEGWIAERRAYNVKAA